MTQLKIVLFCFIGLISCNVPEKFDIIIQNGTIYDGSGNPSVEMNLGIRGDQIAAIGKLNNAQAEKIIDAKGLAVAPGFINMLSWATESLLIDSRGMSDIKQGVTLEVMGEGWSMGPINEKMREELQQQIDSSPEFFKYSIDWTSLGEYLQYLEDKGISPNVASFMGATSARIHELGYEDRAPTPEELENMKALVQVAMEEGALGVGSSLIYAPAFYAQTEELIELCKAASPYGGRYITHMRSEGNKFLEAIDEVIRISKEANIAAEIYHLKAGGKDNWFKMDLAIQKIDSARQAGIDITTDMYNYTAGATGLDAAMPPWVQEGGYEAWANRLKDPAIRKEVAAEMKTNAQDWENLYYHAGAEKVLLSFKTKKLREKFEGKSLAEVAKLLNTSTEEAAMDLVIQDSSRVGAVYFLMSEENIKKQIKLPYMSFGSDAGALPAEGEWLKNSTHPRSYGNFARLLGKYVRDERVIPLTEAIYKLSHLPAKNLKIQRRGLLKKGNFADVVIFDPSTIQDHATFSAPHQYATGMHHVIVNGTLVLENGEHTGATPGRFIKGPGWKKKD